jgi:hypothetical protein
MNKTISEFLHKLPFRLSVPILVYLDEQKRIETDKLFQQLR